MKAAIHQFDPGPACETVGKTIVEDDLQRAIAAGDFEQAQMLAELRSDLNPYVAACAG